MRTQVGVLAVLAVLASGCIGVAGEGDGGAGGGSAGTGGGSAGTGGGSAGTGGGSAGTGGGSAGTGGGSAGTGGGFAGTGGGAGASVVEHHNSPARQGLYLDGALTRAALSTLHRDPGFVAVPDGPVYAQPLFVDRGVNGHDAVLVATENNVVQAFDADGGAELWKATLASPVTTGLPCGNINPLGITGTPYVDLATRTVYLDAMTHPTDGGVARHQVYALALDTGAVKPGWPVDLDAALAAQSPRFTSLTQNQRGALALLDGVLYVPFGGHYGDCGTYYGWVVGLSTTSPRTVTAFHTAARGGGIWNVGGVTSVGQQLFVATGNTFGASTWGGGDGVYRLGPGPSWSGAAADSWAPADWLALDGSDLDMGTALPVDAPGITPSALVAAFGKDGKAYLLDRANLGGVGQELDQVQLSNGELNGAATTYATDAGTFVVLRMEGSGAACTNGAGGELVAITVGPGGTIVPSWCGATSNMGVPIVTMSAPGRDVLVWAVGSTQLHVYDGLTGAELFAGAASDAVSGVSYFNTPIVAKGRVYVAGARVYAFRP